MNLKCIFGIHTWEGCSCSKCKVVRNKEHDFSADCEHCSRCGISARSIITACPDCGDNYRDWVVHPYCQKCKKFIFHDGSENCEVCSKCHTILSETHKWEKNCEKCSVCGTVRENQHNWDGCKCIKCNATRNEMHDWSENCESCSKCMTIRHNYHKMVYKQLCSFECAVCGFIKSVHFFNKCYCPDFAFIHSGTDKRIEERDLTIIKSTLESREIIKNNNEAEYLQFNINDLAKFPLLSNIINLPASGISMYSIDFSVKIKKSIHITESDGNYYTSKDDKLNLSIKRISKDTYILLKK